MNRTGRKEMPQRSEWSARFLDVYGIFFRIGEIRNFIKRRIFIYFDNFIINFAQFTFLV